jgi:hypothetical protein
MEHSPISTIQKTKEYEIESENKKYSVKIKLSSNIEIEIHELDKIQGSFYINEFSLDALVKISRGFKICENISEAFDILEDIFEAKKTKIKIKEDNSIILIIEVILTGGKIQNAEMFLNKKEINKNILIEELVKKVNNLEDDNKKLKEDNKKLKEEINEIKEWKKKIEKLFKDEINCKEVKLHVDSQIIDNLNDLNLIINRLTNNDMNLKQKINLNLLYRATRDGDKFNDFHSRVDNKNSTLTIIKTSLNCKFGVFLDIPIKQTGNSIVDDKSFIFSFNLKKIYNKKSGTYTLNDYKENSGLLFDLWRQPIRIFVNCLSNKSSWTNSNSGVNNSYLGFERDYELNNNQQYFTVSEMETFQISFS